MKHWKSLSFLGIVITTCALVALWGTLVGKPKPKKLSYIDRSMIYLDSMDRVNDQLMHEIDSVLNRLEDELADFENLEYDDRETAEDTGLGEMDWNFDRREISVSEVVEVKPMAATRQMALACNGKFIVNGVYVIALYDNPNDRSPFGFDTDTIRILDIRRGWVKYDWYSDHPNSVSSRIYQWEDDRCSDLIVIKELSY